MKKTIIITFLPLALLGVEEMRFTPPPTGGKYAGIVQVNICFGIEDFAEFVHIDIGHYKFSCNYRDYLFCLLCAGRCATIHLIQR